MAITMSKLCKKLGDKVIFSNFNLEIQDGELVAITGPSGKGKSTLLNIIGLLEDPDSGDIIIKGMKNPWKKEREKIKLIRHSIGYLFQNYALIEQATVSKNLDIALAYSDVEDKKKEKYRALERVGLPEKLNKKVYELSGGEQQRVALARLMLKKSEIILADEPTGSLDMENREDVFNLLKELNEEGKTVVIVSHDPDIAAGCQRRVAL
ncbi:putative ABC transport system ATP-binding protein [Marininema mesophilum]|uniref:Putative ABC transport system ATP-binding protein n=1 Tax=Marininema mesophilum TaxID=1048340 RepID=A0A1H2QHP9_9BACL|nr:putative bacteriocin export ABC transporter [Marininema mesophilum]SDW06723.1 putative ABC transport system ATP-binding protein [Marininema mesophilum]